SEQSRHLQAPPLQLDYRHRKAPPEVLLRRFRNWQRIAVQRYACESPAARTIAPSHASSFDQSFCCWSTTRCCRSPKQVHHNPVTPIEVLQDSRTAENQASRD